MTSAFRFDTALQLGLICRTGCAIGWMGWALGCNSLTGVNDLTVQEVGASGAGGNGSSGSGGSAGSSGGDPGAGGTAAGAGGSDPAGQGGNATCAGATHECNSSCVSNFSVMSCGSSCTPCPVPAYGSATCDGTSCGVACNTGYQLSQRPDQDTCCPVPPGAACDHLTDCGCPAGQTCASDSTGLRSCRAVPAAAVQPYAECEEDAECVASHSCINYVCNAHCRDALDCGFAGAECFDTVFGDGVPVPDFGTCTRNCDPASPAAPRAGFQPCGPGAHCSSVDDTFTTTTCFGFPGNIPAGEACLQFDTECEPGFFCNQADFLCTRWCEVGGAACPDNLLCSGFEVPFVINGIEFGGCF